MSDRQPSDYPIGFSDLVHHLSDEEMPIAEHGADLCAGAVLFAVGHLHPRTMAALAQEVVSRAGSDALSPALCEVASSRDPDRDPEIRPAFRAFLNDARLLRTSDDAWAVLARVGARHARAIAAGIASGALDPIEGALAIAACFDRYLPESERTRLCDPGTPLPLERSTALAPFTAFVRVAEDLYEAGHNLNTWNDALAYAPSNVLSPTEKATALASLRSRYVSQARECLAVPVP